jgi:ubiquitin carboxyl-terminal hydrolase 36/42
VDKPLLGPLLPSPSINGDSKKSREDPQAAALKAKIEVAQQQKAKSTMKGLSQYASDDEDGKDNGADVHSSPSQEIGIDDSRATPNPPPSSSPGPERSSIPPASFYGNGQRPLKKRKSQDFHDRSHQKRPFSNGKINHSNPYNNVVTYSGKNKRRRPPRGI